MLATLNARKMIMQMSDSSDELSFSVPKAKQGICTTVILNIISLAISFDRVKETHEHRDNY
jgi:hypothetical protein